MNYYTEFYLSKLAASAPVVPPLQNPVLPLGLNIPPVTPPQGPMQNVIPPSGSLTPPPVVAPPPPASFRKGFGEIREAIKNTAAGSAQSAKKYGPMAGAGLLTATAGDAALRASGTNPTVSSFLTGATGAQGFVSPNARPKTRAIAGLIGGVTNAAKNLYTNSASGLPNKAPAVAPVAPAPVKPLPNFNSIPTF